MGVNLEPLLNCQEDIKLKLIRTGRKGACSIKQISVVSKITVKMSSGCDGSHDSCGHFVTPSVHQSMNEMEFERGIWTAALNGDVEEVEKHIRKGVDPNCVDSSGYTALHYSSRNGHYDVCETLLRSGAKVNSKTRSGGVTSLQRAAQRGHCKIVSLLLKHGADPSLQDTDGKTALHKAVEGNKTDVVELLLQSSPECTLIQDNKNRLPKDYVDASNTKLLKLLEHGSLPP